MSVKENIYVGAAALAIVAVVAVTVVMLSMERNASFQRGYEAAQRNVLQQIKRGVQDGYPFYLSGIDVRFVPMDHDLATAYPGQSRYYRFCTGCHGSGQ